MLHDLHRSITLINASMQELNKEKDLSEKGRYYLNLAMKLSEYLFHTDSLNPEISNNENQSFVGGTEQLGDSFIKKSHGSSAQQYVERWIRQRIICNSDECESFFIV